MIDITSNLFNIRRRFLRSTHIERDWNDPLALNDYVLTSQAKQSLERLSAGLSPNSGLRAWRITGDYGSGKSSFALFLAHLLSDQNSKLTFDSKELLKQLWGTQNPKPLFPVLITGSREPLSGAVAKALVRSFQNISNNSSNWINEIQEALKNGTVNDSSVIKWVQSAHTFVSKSDWGGLILIIDEAGKFLEFAAMYPDQQDIYLLQNLAEVAARSGTSPLIVLALLHQGVSYYAESLTKGQQREWEKVAGRFEEIAWYHSVDQVAELIANALNVQIEEISLNLIDQANRDMEVALKLRWYGPTSSNKTLSDLAQRFFPLHPTVLPPLVRLFSHFGQNERSLFTFVLGSEPFGLQDFVDASGNTFFRIHNLYDYARTVFGSSLSLQSYRNHWKAIEAIISSYSGNDELELKILKTIGILNVINADDLLASSDIIELSFAGEADVKEALQHLKDKHIIYFRGISGGYSLWPHTSIDLDKAYYNAKKALDPIQDIASFIHDRLDVRPLVARRHYIKTGNLRYFGLVYVKVSDLHIKIKTLPPSDGRIIIPLCETLQDVQQAVNFSTSAVLEEYSETLIAVSRPLHGLISIVDELRCWQWIERNVPELQHDNFAREEVSRQLATHQLLLDEQLQSLIGITNFNSINGLRWFYKSKEQVEIRTGREVMSFLSKVFDELYFLSPRIHNELINRKTLSSAAVGARMRLIERLFESPKKPYLGMDKTKKPPEMSMYLSVLLAAGLHWPGVGDWEVRFPNEKEDKQRCFLLPTLDKIKQLLEKQVDNRVPINSIFEELQKPPYGVREGLIPLLLAVFSVVYEQELALYEDGSFIPRITGSSFLRLIKAPETFEIQFYAVNSIRTELFQKLVQELNLNLLPKTRVDLLDIVKPLVVFAANLSPFVQKTSRLTPQAIAVRETLVNALDPANLIFRDLPLACGLKVIGQGYKADLSEIQLFAERVKNSIDELRSSYPSLLQWIFEKLQNEFQLKDSFETVRKSLAPRAKSLSSFVTEARLKSFCLRLADTNLAEDKWLESLGNLVCAMPPSKWRDADAYKYEQEIHNLCSQFIRVEAVMFNRTNKGHQKGDSVRVALTQLNGQERDQVIYLSPDEEVQAQEIEMEVSKLLNKHGRIGMAAATRVLWNMLNTSQEK
jgi:hypothetical protein